VRREREDERESGKRESGRSSKFIVWKTFNLTLAVSFKYQCLPLLQSNPLPLPTETFLLMTATTEKKRMTKQ